MSGVITFGTDGWRGVVAQDFTFENVGRVGKGIAAYLNAHYKKPSCAIGFDTRFLSSDFAQYAAHILAEEGIKVYLSKAYNTTPALSYLVRKRKLSGGIMISASHNPSFYNGIKFKTEEGISAIEQVTRYVESNIPQAAPAFSYIVGTKRPILHSCITVCDFEREYVDFLRSYANLEVLKKCGLRIIYDTMHGAGEGIMPKALAGTDVEIISLRDQPSPTFGGVDPEPIEVNLGLLKENIIQKSCDLGIGIDGDGDRVGIVSGRGDYVESGKVFSLLLLYLIENRLYRGSVVKTVSSTSLVDKIAQKYNLPLYETPIGFKNIAQIMMRETVLMGAEESGGMGFLNFMPERDGILSGILLVEMLAERKKSLEAILAEVEAEYGGYEYAREDVYCEGITRDVFCQKILTDPLRDLDGSEVCDVRSSDGIKYIAKDGSWLLLRFSGTEPILRIYSEASTKKKVKKLLELGKQTALHLGAKIREK